MLRCIRENFWLLSSLAVLAKREDLVKEVLVTREICPQYIFRSKSTDTIIIDTDDK